MPRVPPLAGTVLIILLLGVVLFLSLPGAYLWQRVVQDAGHGPVFAGIAVVFLLMRELPPGVNMRPTACYLQAFLLATGLGILTELIQFTLPGRSVSFMDALHDAAGAALGLVLLWFVERIRASGSAVTADHAAGRSVAALALLALTVLAWQPLQCARAYAARESAFPVLAPMGVRADEQFARPHRASLSYTPLPERFRRPGDRDSIRLDFQSGVAFGLQLLEPMPDWRSHGVLALDLTNPGPASALVRVRVSDAQHNWTNEDRFNQDVEIPAATRATIRFSLEAIATAPARRRMDMGHLSNLLLYARRPLPGGEFYVTRVWLE